MHTNVLELMFIQLKKLKEASSQEALEIGLNFSVFCAVPERVLYARRLPLYNLSCSTNALSGVLVSLELVCEVDKLFTLSPCLVMKFGTV